MAIYSGFSIAMLVYQRVDHLMTPFQDPWNTWFLQLFRLEDRISKAESEVKRWGEAGVLGI